MGEKQGDRAAMERVTKRLIKGGVKPSEAVNQARESMIRTDKAEQKRGRR